MAKFTVTIETGQECMPGTRLEQSREQYRLRDCLVLITSAVINRGLTDGTVTGIDGVCGTYTYAAKPQKTTPKPAA